MPTATIPAFPAGKYVIFEVIDYDTDGVTPDVTELLTVTGTFPAIATVALVPGDLRKIKVTGVAAGNMSITVSAPGVPSNAALVVSCTITTPPNLSRIEIGAVEAPV